MARVNPELIALARESRGYTQKELADLLGIPQGRISKVEKGLAVVSDELLSSLAHELKYPAAFFEQSAEIFATDLTLHRKRVSLPRRTLETIQAQLSIRKLHLAELLDDITFPEYKINSYSPSDGNSPEVIARKVRKDFKLPPGPIGSVTHCLESAGVLIVPIDFGHRYIDAVCCKRNGLPTTIFINSTSPGDRQRFTLAHELGHLVMHATPTENMEVEADQFASEFLMPAKDIRDQLEEVSMRDLWKLKPEWKVSMAALIKRASVLGCIEKNRERYLWIQLSKAGYRLEEPLALAIPQEKSTFMTQIIELNLEDCSRTEISERLCIEEDEFVRMYLGEEQKRKSKELRLN